ncbi:hypothetical protein ACFOPQ_11830 [Deinococcus antarcticus]|uniref:Outer membrane protein beta-barrel domain-containing protein n=1 Tax=Deinococcus antarcticus TaxID=1298767 RepID=A0ABV8A7W7_9DEIO
MKKTLIGLMALSALSTASAANYVGGSIGTGGSIHYQQDRAPGTATRYSLDLNTTGFNFGTLSLGGSVDYLMNVPQTTPSALVPYYGAGLGAYVGLGGGVGISVYPHVLLGAKYNVNATPFSVFGELNAGYAIGFASASGVTVGGSGFNWGARLGLNYMLGN